MENSVSQVDPEVKALQDSIFLSKVARARRTPMSEKLADGPLLFDQNIRFMRGVIQSEHSEFTPEQVEKEIDRRLRIAKMICSQNIYRNVGVVDEQS